MKEFSQLRTELQESVESLQEHSPLQGQMPPNILILRRKSVRQFPNQMVALYYNEKLDQYFSIPYGGSAQTIVTPASLKEGFEDAHQPEGWMNAFESEVLSREPRHAGQIDWNLANALRIEGHTPETAAINYVEEKLGTLRTPDYGKTEELGEQSRFDAEREKEFKQQEAKYTKHYDAEQSKRHKKVRQELTENVMTHLHKVKNFETSKSLRHDDGTQTKVDPTTASALLTVHGALKPEHQEKFTKMMAHSKPQFMKAVDFAWKHVK